MTDMLGTTPPKIRFAAGIPARLPHRILRAQNLILEAQSLNVEAQSLITEILLTATGFAGQWPATGNQQTIRPSFRQGVAESRARDGKTDSPLITWCGSPLVGRPLMRFAPSRWCYSEQPTALTASYD